MPWDLFLFFALSQFAAGMSPSKQHGMVAPSSSVVHTFLRQSNATIESINTTRSNSTSDVSLRLQGPMPCQCQAFSAAWRAPARKYKKCVFIDLGAADGNSFNVFLNNGYGPVKNCPNSAWEAILVEANPRFNWPLRQTAAKYPGKVTAMSATAAYMCEGKTSFYLDTVNHDKNYWGSSMSHNHPDTVKSGRRKVTVPTVNLNKLLAEHTIPGDYVLVKMDIEGSEFDVVPCLARSMFARLVDKLYMEEHNPSWGLAGTTPAQFQQAKTALRKAGVVIPQYRSNTL